MLGYAVQDRLDQRRFRRWTQGLLVLTGLNLVRLALMTPRDRSLGHESLGRCRSAQPMAAAFTSASMKGTYWAKFFCEHAHQLLRPARHRRPGRPRCRAGRAGAASTPGTATGTSKPKFGSLRNSPVASEPSSAAVSSARVALIGIRLPVP